MRLIDAETFKLRFFLGDVPAYAILSHMWGDDEVTFQDMEKGVDHAGTMLGFEKIRGCCAQALRDGYRWAWVDTCCIDKTSSTELSEAINSMYRWYQQSAVCYVYMSDVTVDDDAAAAEDGGPGRSGRGSWAGRTSSPPTGGPTTAAAAAGPTTPVLSPTSPVVMISPGWGGRRDNLNRLMGGVVAGLGGGRSTSLPPPPPPPPPPAFPFPPPLPSFPRSRWFRRGWTLQELIAPRTLIFYDSHWAEIGTKASLASQVRRVTNVPLGVLRGREPVSACTVGERMSWASWRLTTREEDRAYSLLGIFDVNMPLLYGEGRRAFIRLQEEILRHGEDLSLLAWTDPGLRGHSVGVLADSPAGFTSVLFTDNSTDQAPPPLIADDGDDDDDNMMMMTMMASGGSEGEGDDERRSGRVRQGFTWRDVRLVRAEDVVPEIGLVHRPPEITGRGISVTLLVRRPADMGIRDHDDYLVAWVFLKTQFHRQDGSGRDVCFCVMIRPVDQPASRLFDDAAGPVLDDKQGHHHDGSKIKQGGRRDGGAEGGGGLQGKGASLVASRGVSGRAAGLICVRESDVRKYFTPQKLYLSYAVPRPAARTEWATHEATSSLLLERVAMPEDVGLRFENATYYELHIQLQMASAAGGGASEVETRGRWGRPPRPPRLRVVSHHPADPFLAELRNGRYGLFVRQPTRRGGPPEDEVGRVSLVCSYDEASEEEEEEYGHHRQPSSSSPASQRFVVDFTTFHLGSSHHFSCHITRYETAVASLLSSPVESFWTRNAKVAANMAPADRAHHVLDGGQAVTAAIKEHVSWVREMRVVQVTLSISVA